jgi:3-deoxy-7-phosphoheptulonate synthase
MVILLDPLLAPADLDALRERVEALGARTTVTRDAAHVRVSCLGDAAVLRGVAAVAPEAAPRVSVPSDLRRAARAAAPGGTVVRVADRAGAAMGGTELAVIAGPCSVEGLEMLRQTARAVAGAGAGMLRGGAFKPRSSPYAFQGLGEDGLRMLARVRAETGMPVVTEVLDPRQVEAVAEHADVLQIGARNMQNFALLAEVGRVRRPVLLKRGLSATVRELLLAAEYVLARGNPDVILCERGIRTYETATRNTLDIGAIPVLRAETHLPVIVDPSHAAGRADLVAPLACAAVAAGADGLIVEVHPDPAAARSDGEQSLTPAAFASLMDRLRPFAAAAGRTLPVAAAAGAEAAWARRMRTPAPRRWRSSATASSGSTGRWWRGSPRGWSSRGGRAR